ncbi:MAG: hypothetical protein KF752_02855 [Pirellulaceae bacterium]|nr:hypothetical protein [Pirellulaceae bacterium]
MSYTRRRTEDEARPSPEQIKAMVFALIWDKVYDVHHLDGVGGTTTSHGKLKDLDQDGFVVLEDDNGNIILIPKDKVVDLKHTPEKP